MCASRTPSTRKRGFLLLILLFFSSVVRQKGVPGASISSNHPSLWCSSSHTADRKEGSLRLVSTSPPCISSSDAQSWRRKCEGHLDIFYLFSWNQKTQSAAGSRSNVTSGACTGGLQVALMLSRTVSLTSTRCSFTRVEIFQQKDEEFWKVKIFVCSSKSFNFVKINRL